MVPAALRDTCIFISLSNQVAECHLKPLSMPLLLSPAPCGAFLTRTHLTCSFSFCLPHYPLCFIPPTSYVCVNTWLQRLSLCSHLLLPTCVWTRGFRSSPHVHTSYFLHVCEHVASYPLPVFTPPTSYMCVNTWLQRLSPCSHLRLPTCM